MPSDRDLEQQLRDFGATLADQAAEPIGPSGAAVRPLAAGRGRRQWALAGAAACVVALVVGLLAFGRADEPEQGAAAPSTSVPNPPATTSASISQSVTTDPPPDVTGPASSTPGGIEQYVPDDPLGLLAEGWKLESREVVAFAVDAEGSTCEGVTILAGLDGLPTVHEIYTTPARPGFDLDVTYFPRTAGADLARGFAALGACPEIADAGTVTPVETAAEGAAAGFRLDDTFALIAVAPNEPGAAVPLSIALELESVGVTDELIGELVGRSIAFLTGDDAAPADEVGGAEVLSRSVTADELAALEGDSAGLTCDAFGTGATEWDYGPIDGSEPTGRLPVDAFRDGLAEVREQALREGADAPPIDGWTELVVDDSRSIFVLEVDGVWQGNIRVSGDPALGVWRHNSADFCQALFIPDGVVPPTEPPVATSAAPAPQPPDTTGVPESTTGG